MPSRDAPTASGRCDSLHRRRAPDRRLLGEPRLPGKSAGTRCAYGRWGEPLDTPHGHEVAAARHGATARTTGRGWSPTAGPRMRDRRCDPPAVGPPAGRIDAVGPVAGGRRPVGPVAGGRRPVGPVAGGRRPVGPVAGGRRPVGPPVERTAGVVRTWSAPGPRPSWTSGPWTRRSARTWSSGRGRRST